MSKRESTAWLRELRAAVEEATEDDEQTAPWSTRQLGLALALGGVLLAAVAGVVVYLRGPSTAGAPSHPTVTLVSVRQLQRLPGSLRHPIYWAGPRPKVRYELTRMPDGRIYLRYLPSGMRIRSSKPALAIGTLPLPHALATTKTTAKRTGARTVRLTGGGIATLAPGERRAYLAYPAHDYQAEVFAPHPATAWKLAKAGQIRAIR